MATGMLDRPSVGKANVVGKVPGLVSGGMRHYPSYIATMAERADATMIVVNGGSEAAVILAQLISMATAEIKILTGCLTENIFGQKNVLDAIGTVCRMRMHVKVQILHQYPIPSGNPFKRILEIDGGKSIDVRRLNPASPTSARFVVVDQRHFQYEPDNQEGIVFFGEISQAHRISNAFDALWDKSAD